MENTTLTGRPERASDSADDAVREHHDRFQLIVFKLGAEEYAIHIDQIKEVVLTPRITKMPQTPLHVRGVANVRGSVLAILDLEEKFGIRRDTTSQDTANYTLVAAHRDFNVGILVKEVPNTLTVAAGDIEESVNVVPDTEAHGNYVLGIVKSDERLIVLMDLVRIMQTHAPNEVVPKASVHS